MTILIKIREDLKKTDYLSGIDHISFNTHPILGVGKFTTHPPWRNNDKFLEKVGFEEVFQQLNYKGISELFFFEAIPSLKLPFNPHQKAVSESLNRLGGAKGPH